MRCPECGAQVDDSYKFCARCGHSFEPGVGGQSQSSPQLRREGAPISLIVVSVVVALIVVAAIVGAFFVQKPNEVLPHQTPTLVYTERSVEGGIRITLLGITQNNVHWSGVRISLSGDNTWAEWYPASADLDGSQRVTASYGSILLGPASVSLSVTDLEGDGHLGSGDFYDLIANPGFSSLTTYSTHLLYEPTMEKMGTGLTFVG